MDENLDARCKPYKSLQNAHNFVKQELSTMNINNKLKHIS